MRVSGTLTVYIGRVFLFWISATMAALCGVVFLFDLIELLRRSGGKEAATFPRMLELALLKLPAMAEILLPFAVLFGGMLAFSRLTRSHELVVTRAAGVSVWQILLPALILAIVIGALRPVMINPISAALSDRYETLEAEFLKRRTKMMSIASNGLWVRERSREQVLILRAGAVDSDDRLFETVELYVFTPDDVFLARVDAARARLDRGQWLLSAARRTDADGRVRHFDELRFPTTLTLANLQDSLVSPQAIGFWDLPKFITILEDAGFSAVRHRLHLHRLLATPLLLCAMVLMAAALTLRLMRSGGSLVRVTGGLMFAFGFYFCSDVVYALGLSARIPEVMAAWGPTLVITLTGFTWLLYLEDG